MNQTIVTDFQPIDSPTGTVVAHARTWNRSRTNREMFRNSRVFVGTDAAFDLAEDLANRTRRPFAAWRKAMVPLLAEAGLPTTGIRWSQFAGCTCPCSPGFVLPTVVFVDNRPADFWVVLRGAPDVDPSLPARELVVL